VQNRNVVPKCCVLTSQSTVHLVFVISKAQTQPHANFAATFSVCVFCPY